MSVAEALVIDAVQIRGALRALRDGGEDLDAQPALRVATGVGSDSRQVPLTEACRVASRAFHAGGKYFRGFPTFAVFVCLMGALLTFSGGHVDPHLGLKSVFRPSAGDPAGWKPNPSLAEKVMKKSHGLFGALALISAAPAFAQAQSGNHVLRLPTASSAVSIAHDAIQFAPNNAKAITIEYWVRFESTPVSGRPVCKRGCGSSGYTINIFSGSTAIEFGGVWAESITTPSNQWYHFATTWSAASGKLRIYLDGALAREIATTGQNLEQITEPLTFGAFCNRGFVGAMDNIRIWSVARSQAEIVADRYNEYAPSVAASKAGLVGAWSFESGNGTSAIDDAGRNPQGALSGGAAIELNQFISGPTQWSTASGGNGHWYEVVVPGGSITWEAAMAAAEARGGHLATIADSAENAFLFNLSTAKPGAWSRSTWNFGPWLGLRREPLGGSSWIWINGESLGYTAWMVGRSGCGRSQPDSPTQSYGCFGNGCASSPTAEWSDSENAEPVKSYIIEWDLDCNGDDVVDYGQILSGALADLNENGFVDSCEGALGLPLEWTSGAGGNGHWYRKITATTTWAQASAIAESMGGHLATLTSSAENAFLENFAVGDYWLGAFQPPAACEPGCDWRWVTDETWSYTNWRPGQPDNAGGIEDVLAFYPGAVTWNDRGNGSCGVGCEMPGFVVEWSDDCNGDGKVDFGQIRSGELADVDGDGRPDVCQPSDGSATQWANGAGANGHWYELVPHRTSWSQARWECEARGGHLATITSAPENAFIATLGSVGDLWLGGFQPALSCEPLCDWRWVTGEAWSYTNWRSGQPDDAGNIEDSLSFHPGSTVWNDRGSCAVGCEQPGYVIEWSADCNADGQVDHGQILSGELVDRDADGVPDACECGTNPNQMFCCTSDMDLDGEVGASDISLILLSLGELRVSAPALDLDGDGIVTAGDLAIVLMDYGPCP